MSRPFPYQLNLSLFDWLIELKLDDQNLLQILTAIYKPFIVQQRISPNKICYKISTKMNKNGAVSYFRSGEWQKITSVNLADFLYLLEKDITISLQLKRKDLLFIHSAVIEHNNQAIMVVAPSGTGKSTTTWGLLHCGFNYLSDELAPIDLNTMLVYGYPRALCLKDRPPFFPLPKAIIETNSKYHVPPEVLPCLWNTKAIPISVIYVLEYKPDVAETHATRLSLTESAMHLFANALNPLAHEGKGLDAAIAISTKVPCYRLTSNRNLPEIIKTIKGYS